MIKNSADCVKVAVLLPVTNIAANPSASCGAASRRIIDQCKLPSARMMLAKQFARCIASAAAMIADQGISGRTTDRSAQPRTPTSKGPISTYSNNANPVIRPPSDKARSNINGAPHETMLDPTIDSPQITINWPSASKPSQAANPTITAKFRPTIPIRTTIAGAALPVARFLMIDANMTLKRENCAVNHAPRRFIGHSL
jgi:hypothetical protein